MNASLQETPLAPMASASKAPRPSGLVRWAAAVRAGWRSQPWLVGAILAAHVLLGVLYSATVPLWEAHDEWAHYKYVEYVARHRSLPPIGQRLTYEYAYDEADQPPLYYVLAALPVLFVDTSDGLTPEVNPYAATGTGAGGVNFAIHHPEIERFPYRGTVLAAHLARFVSVLLSTLALVAAFALGRLAAPFVRLPGVSSRQVSVGALAIAAFSPQFLFTSSVITNDVLIAVLGSWVAVFSLRVALPGSRLRDMMILAGLVGLALLTKYTALALALMALVAAGIGLGRQFRSPATAEGRASNTLSEGPLHEVPAQSRRRERISGWAMVGAGLVVLAGVAGWWFWRNVRQSGLLLPRDPWAVYWFIEYLRRPLGALSELNWGAIPGMLVYGFQTFWASFGWGNVGAPKWVYWLFAAVVAAGAVGLIRAFCRRDRAPNARLVMLLLLLQVALVIALPLARETLHHASELRGRYLLPALAPVSVLIAWGLSQLPRPFARSPLGDWIAHGGPIAVVGVGLLLLDLALLWWLILPAYRPPRLLADAGLQPNEIPLHAIFDDKTELVAYDVWPREVKAGDGVAVTLLWKALGPFDRNYTVGIHLLGEGSLDYGQLNVYPGRGNFATELWQPGDIFRETYWVQVQPPEGARVPTGGRVAVALFVDGADQPHLPVTDPQGHALGEAVIFGRFRIAPSATSEDPLQRVASLPTSAPLGRVGNAIELAGIGLTQPNPLMASSLLPVTATWHATGTPPADLTSFLHLMSADGHQVAGLDAPPRASYPTGLWATGDMIEQRFDLKLPADLPSGQYRLVLGMYRPDTMERSSVTDSAGRPAPENALEIARLDVVARTHERWIPMIEASRR